MTKKEWLKGNIPVVYYPAKEIETARFKVDESYPDEAILEVALLPKDAEKVKPQVFYIGLKKSGEGTRRPLEVNYWAPRGGTRPDPDATGLAAVVPGRLASPRFRRRAFKGGLLLAVVGAGPSSASSTGTRRRSSRRRDTGRPTCMCRRSRSRWRPPSGAR